MHEDNDLVYKSDSKSDKDLDCCTIESVLTEVSETILNTFHACYDFLISNIES
jgi:hypothetical protein